MENVLSLCGVVAKRAFINMYRCNVTAMCIIQSFSITITLLWHLCLNVDPFKSPWIDSVPFMELHRLFQKLKSLFFFNWKFYILRSRFVSLSPSINIYFYCCQSCWHAPVTLMRWPCRAVNYIYITAVPGKKRKEKRGYFKLFHFLLSVSRLSIKEQGKSLFSLGEIFILTLLFFSGSAPFNAKLLTTWKNRFLVH